MYRIAKKRKKARSRGLHNAAWSAASTRRLDPLLSAPSCDMAVGKDVCLSLPERETTEIVMCVPSLVPSLATQIKSSSLLLLNQVGDQAPASCRLIPPNGGGGGAEGLIGHAG